MTPAQAEQLIRDAAGLFEGTNGTRGHKRSHPIHWPPAQELFEPSPSKRYEEYRYHYSNGSYAYSKIRSALPDGSKTFRHKPDGITGHKQVPYHLPLLIEAVRLGETVFITEGEKDADALILHGVAATTFSAGWKDHFAPYFQGGHVVIVADRDDDPVKPGLRKALRVAAALQGVAGSIRVVGAKVGSDAADHLWNGYGVDDFVEYEPADGQVFLGEGVRPPTEDADGQGSLSKDVRPLVVYTNLDAPVESNTEWIAWPFTAMGPVRTSVVGDPKEGKTTYALALASAVIRGVSFLDRPTIQMPVVYLSEQSQATFYRQIPPALKAYDRAGLYYIPFPSNFGFSWAEFVHGGIETCLTVGGQLLIIDTVGKFSQIEDEADPRDVANALNELDRAHSEGISVMILKHSRKSGGSITTAAAGSYKWNADVDHICYLTKPKGIGEHQRKLECIGRLDDAIGEWTLDYAPETREVALLGDFEAVEELSIAELIRDELVVGEIVTPKEIAKRILKDADSCRKAMQRKREWFEHLPEGKYKRLL